MPIKWKSKIFLAKNEASYGVDPTLTGAANGFLATNITLSPMEGQDVSRDLELPWLAAQATIPGGLYSRLTFRIELVGSGAAGTPPAWGPVLRACAVSQTLVALTSVTYRPLSEAHESVHIHLWVGPTRYVFKGTRGDATMRVDAQGIAYLEFTMTGLFTLPSDETRPTPNLSAFLEPKVVSSANTPVFTIDGAGFVMRNFSLALGNDVQTRFLVGSEGVHIVDKRELITTQVEAVALSVFDPYQAALDADPIAIVLQHEATAGRTIRFTAPTCQIQRPAGLANSQNVVEWPLRFVPLPTTGNDQWELVLT